MKMGWANVCGHSFGSLCGHSFGWLQESSLVLKWQSILEDYSSVGQEWRF